MVLLYLDLFYCNKINILSIYLLNIKCKLFLMIIDIEIKNFLICIVMCLDEFIKEVLIIFFVMNFIFIERYKNLIKYILYINLKIFLILIFIYFVCNL